MSDQPAETQPAVDSSQQVTSKIPTTLPTKNPKRGAAGKAVAEKTRQARKAQKKAAAEAAVIIANNKAKETLGPHVSDVSEDTNTSRNVLTTTQWLSVVSICVSMLGLYHKREEIKRVFSKNAPQTPLLSPEMQRPPPPQSKKGIRRMED